MLADLIARVNGNKDIPMTNWFYMDDIDRDELRKREDLKAFMAIRDMVKAKENG